MTSDVASKLRVFCVYEPSYWRGFLITMGSLVRHASEPLTIDVLLRSNHLDIAAQHVQLLQSRVGQKARFNIVPVPADVVESCSQFRFGAHFIPEILFRLSYFEVVHPDAELVLYCDIDMIWRGDVFQIFQEFSSDKLMAAVRTELPEVSRPVLPPSLTNYVNSGLLVFRTSRREEVREAMAEIRAVLPSISDRSVYLDQDAINVVMHERLHHLPPRWNFTTSDIPRGEVEQAVILHATGSRKPWHLWGGHPFTRQYDEERRALRLSLPSAYDPFWAITKIRNRFINR